MLTKAAFIKRLDDNAESINPMSKVAMCERANDCYALYIETKDAPNHFLSLHKYGSATGEKACESYRVWLREWVKARTAERAAKPDNDLAFALCSEAVDTYMEIRRSKDWVFQAGASYDKCVWRIMHRATKIAVEFYRDQDDGSYRWLDMGTGWGSGCFPTIREVLTSFVTNFQSGAPHDDAVTPRKTRDDVITALKDSAPDASLSDYVAALEDGAALKALGFTDADQDVIEEVHAYLKGRIEHKQRLSTVVTERSQIGTNSDRVHQMEKVARDAFTKPKETAKPAPRVYESTAAALKSGHYDRFGVGATAQLVSDMQRSLVRIEPVIHPEKCLLRVGLRFARWFDSPEEARRGYEVMRDDSGEGASTWPNGVIVLSDAQTVIYVSYNGRAWYDRDGAHAVPLPLPPTKALIAGSAAMKDVPAPSEALSIRERYTAIVISTAHITAQDSETLAGARYNGDKDSGCHFIHDIPGGYCLRLFAAGDDWGPQLYDLGLSQAAIWNLARLYNEGYGVVMLQADGDVIDNLKSWEW